MKTRMIHLPRTQEQTWDAETMAMAQEALENCMIYLTIQ